MNMCLFVSNQRTACARSVNVLVRVTSTGSDASVSKTTAEATEQDFTLSSNQMYPVSLHDICQGIQTIRPLGSQDETNESQQNVDSIDTLFLERTSPFLIHDKLSSVPLPRDPANKSDSPALHDIYPIVVRVELGSFGQACSNSASSPTSNKATCCSSVVWFRQVTRATLTGASRGLPIVAPPGHKSHGETCPCTSSGARQG